MADDQGPLKVFIGNLPKDGTNGDIETVLDAAGLTIEEIRQFDIHMVRDRETDTFKGFAYVEVRTQEQLDKVISINGFEFDGRPLRIDNKTGRGGGRGGRGGRGGGRGGPRGGGGFDGPPRGGRGGYGGGGHHRGENEFEVVRGRHHHGRGGRGGYERQRNDSHRNEPTYNEQPIVAGDDSGRPRLQLQKRTTDPKEVEERKKKELEEEKARQQKIFGSGAPQ